MQNLLFEAPMERIFHMRTRVLAEKQRGMGHAFVDAIPFPIRCNALIPCKDGIRMLSGFHFNTSIFIVFTYSPASIRRK